MRTFKVLLAVAGAALVATCSSSLSTPADTGPDAGAGGSNGARGLGGTNGLGGSAAQAAGSGPAVRAGCWCSAEPAV
jgi:hypothetical protein